MDDNKALIDYRENRKGQWPEEDAFVKKLYTQMVESDIYEMYITKEDFSYEADREVVRKLYKTLCATMTTLTPCSRNTLFIGMTTSRW